MHACIHAATSCSAGQRATTATKHYGVYIHVVYMGGHVHAPYHTHAHFTPYMHACIHAGTFCSACQTVATVPSAHEGINNGGHAFPHRVLCAQSQVAIPLWVVSPQSSAVRRCSGYKRQPTTCACLEASWTRHVDPTDERLDIVILDWKCVALETA